MNCDQGSREGPQRFSSSSSAQTFLHDAVAKELQSMRAGILAEKRRWKIHYTETKGTAYGSADTEPQPERMSTVHRELNAGIYRFSQQIL